MSNSPAAVLSGDQLVILKKKALDARNVSYCPYSNFRVGCAILTSSGEYIIGANVENASYGGTICAERTAVVKAVTEGYKNFIAIGVATDVSPPTAPCGICRQVIREFSPNVPIYMFSPTGEFEMMTLDQLMPKSFGPENLLSPEKLSKSSHINI